MPSTRRGVRVWVRTYLVALTAAVAVLLAAVVGVNRYYDEKLDDIPTIDVDVAESTDPGGPMNFLVIGSDSRAFVDNEDQEEAFGSPTEQTGQRSDTIMVVQVDPETETGLAVSFPRDLRVDIPNEGPDKINAAYNDEDGPNKLIETLFQNFGVPIHHYVEVDFAGFQGIVDAVGGVPLVLDAPARDPCTKLFINPFGVTYPFEFVLFGEDALKYVRSRHYEKLINGTWVPDQKSDVGRVERQQDFLRRLAAEAIRLALSDPVRGNRIANETLASITTDDELDRGDVDALIRSFRSVDPNRNQTLETVTFPWTDAGDNVNLLPDHERAQPWLERLRLDAPPPPPSGAPSGVPSGAMATISFSVPVAAGEPDDPNELECDEG